MATKTLYFKNTLAPGSVTSFGLQDGGTAPTAGITATGWTVAKLAAPNMSLMVCGGERSSVTFGASDALTGFSATSSFRTDNAITGIFANTNWSFAFRLRAVTSASSQTGQMRIRLYKSTSADGSGATSLMSGSVAGTTTAAMSTSASATSTVTWTPGATVTLANEYLWVMCEWSIVGTSGNNNADVLFYIESAGAITTPDFVPSTAYTDTITPSSAPIVGATITPVYVTRFHTDTIEPSGVPITGSNITPVYGGVLTETTVFSATLNTNSAGWGTYGIRTVLPVTGMADAQFLVVVMDLGATSDLRLISGLGAIDGPGDGGMVAYQGPPVSTYNRAFELGGRSDGQIACVNEVQIRGSGTTREIRARLEGPSASTFNAITAGIGVWDGTNSPLPPHQGSTDFTPVQLKWSGVASISLSSGAQSYSDWVTFPDNISAGYGPHAMPSVNSGWNGYTFVVSMPPADLHAADGGTEVRLGLCFAVSTSAGQTTVAYLGQADPLGDAYDFRPAPAPAPVRLTFGGNDTLTHDGVTGYLLSDWVTLPEPWDSTKTYALACQFAGGGTTDMHYSSAITVGGSSYYKSSAAEAALLNKTGYTQFFVNNPGLIEIIEVRVVGGSVGYTDTITAGAVPLDGQTITPVHSTGPTDYTDTITPSAVPLVGASITDRFAVSDTIEPSSVPIAGAIFADVYARSVTLTAGAVPIVGATVTPFRTISYADTITPSAVPITGSTIAPVYSAKYSDTITAGAVPITGATITPVYTARYSDTITAGDLPIGGATITPIFSAGGINYTDTITPSAVPITGATITPVFTKRYADTITAGAVPLVGLTLADVFARREIIVSGAVPIVGQPVTPVFAVGAPTGKTWVNVGGVWKETTTHVKVGGVWVHPVAAFVKDGGAWKAIQ